ncbi:sporulation integral membrane protein YtvI [Ornithinibacillus halophilus]|uniref:Sporulation integral membrane protein YtvI n=1 Tax=Ornithinibacillus halophilus TaxID=930117 RepID=A0A1M5EGA9_9BACI|nr:sporulation integral membrane protein YtvI [Ornithinibacillus halophilus]SHF78174.1 sporulation integral membrane protein YtvI [Ornithinibacillus halophilus]
MYKPLLLKLARGLIVVAIIFCAYLLAITTISYILPFLIAIVIAIILHPFVHALEKIKIPRTLGTISALSIIFCIFIGFLFLIVSEIIQGTAYLSEKIPSYFESFVSLTEDWITNQLLPIYHNFSSYFHALNESQQTSIQDYVQNLLNDIATTGGTLLQDFFKNIPNYIATVPSSFSFLIFTLLATFFITKDWNTIRFFVKKHTPAQVQAYTGNFITHLKKALSGYVKAQLLLITISTVIIFIGLIILKVEHALTITLLTVIFDVLPFIGTGVIFIPWIVYTFLVADYSMTIGLTILYMCVIISRQLLEPKILSSSIGINPLVGLIILFVSFQIWGVLGILLAPMLIILVNVLLESGIFKQVWLFVKG